MDTGVVGITAKISAISALMGSLVAFWVKVAKPYLNKRKDKKNELYVMINNIHNELKTNGGSSVKDAILRLETGQHKIIARLDGIDESQKISLNLQGTAFWISDEDGGCSYASPGLCKITGHSESDILGNKWIGWVIPAERERLFEAWLFSVENRTVFDEIYTFKRSDGLYQKVWGLCFHKTVNDNHAGSLGKIDAIGEPFK